MVNSKNLYGEYSHNMDAKGRIAMPAAFRSALGTACYVTIGFDGCLSVYSEEEWDRLSEKLARLPMSNAESRSISRLLLGYARKCEFDSQGRIMLFPNQIAYAKLTKECSIIGVSSKAEIWNRAIWKEKMDAELEHFEETAEKLGGLLNVTL